MRILCLIGAVLFIAAGLLLLIAVPVVGVISIAIGAFLIYQFKKLKKSPTVEQSFDDIDDTQIFNVAGFDYRQDELQELLHEENPDYTLTKKSFIENADGRVYQYDMEYYPARLVPENNEHDPNAIAVYVEDVKIGYIARKDQKDIDFEKIKEAEAEIYGGKYKEVSFDDYEETIVTGETPYRARLYITLK